MTPYIVSASVELYLHGCRPLPPADSCFYFNLLNIVSYRIDIIIVTANLKITQFTSNKGENYSTIHSCAIILFRIKCVSKVENKWKRKETENDYTLSNWTYKGCQYTKENSELDQKFQILKSISGMIKDISY